MKKRALRNFRKFTGKQLCQRLFFSKFAGLRTCCLPVLQLRSSYLAVTCYIAALELTYSYLAGRVTKPPTTNRSPTGHQPPTTNLPTGPPSTHRPTTTNPPTASPLNHWPTNKSSIDLSITGHLISKVDSKEWVFGIILSVRT